MKLWGGRFGKETSSLVNDFNESISFDQRLYRQDIQGSMAHANMLARKGILTEEDNAAIQSGLAGILADIEAGNVEFTAENEDIHMNVEALLTARIGSAGNTSPLTEGMWTISTEMTRPGPWANAPAAAP